LSIIPRRHEEARRQQTQAPHSRKGGGTAVNVTRLFYTVPAVTALMAWAIFSETLTGLSLLGMGVAVLGVWLARGR
jgi:drug/metabolite transporter (DMT)-like permease